MRGGECAGQMSRAEVRQFPDDIDSPDFGIYNIYWVFVETNFPRANRGRSADERWMDRMKKALISVTGLDATGIIAKVATKLSELNINILDISQTILGGYFTMMMIVDLSGAPVDFEGVNKALQPIREELKMEIHIQRMDIFDAMHRV